MARTRRLLASFALLALFAGGAGACSDASTSVSTRSSWVGTWSGTYEFSIEDGSSATSPLLLVIERQDGHLLWGHEEFVDHGTTITVPLNGSATADDGGFLLAAPGLTFEARLTSATTVQLDFFKVTEPSTAFSTVLTLQQ